MPLAGVCFNRLFAPHPKSWPCPPCAAGQATLAPGGLPGRPLETLNVKPRLATTTVPAARTLRFATPLLALMVALAGCSSLDGLTSGDKVDYRTRAAKTEPLDVPPDLTQLARDGRYQPQSGVVSASTLKQGGGVGGGIAAAPAAAVVAPTALADMRIERQGNSRWLVSGLPPETLYPLLRGFWLERGFTLAEDNPQIGVMETSWAENRAKIPMDIVRSTLGRVFDNLYSTSERDRFRTRIERTATGSEVYISHRGMQEIYTDQRREQTIWQPRPTDPGLEAEFLSRLMVTRQGRSQTESTVSAACRDPNCVARVAARRSYKLFSQFLGACRHHRNGGFNADPSRQYRDRR